MVVCLEVGDWVSPGGRPLAKFWYLHIPQLPDIVVSAISFFCEAPGSSVPNFTIGFFWDRPQTGLSEGQHADAQSRPSSDKGREERHEGSNIKVCTFPDNRQTLDQDQDKVKAVGAYWERDLGNSSDPRCALRPDHCQRHQCYPAPHPATIRHTTTYGSKSRQDRQTWIVPFP
jgi:hypothetical protein